MQTRSSNSPPQSVIGSSQQGHQGAPLSGGEAAVRSMPASAPVNKHGQWSVEEESDLIGFLSDRRAEAGDGAGFKQSVCTAAAAHMSGLHGIVYNANQCSGKWGRVRPFILPPLLLLTVAR